MIWPDGRVLMCSQRQEVAQRVRAVPPGVVPPGRDPYRGHEFHLSRLFRFPEPPLSSSGGYHARAQNSAQSRPCAPISLYDRYGRHTIDLEHPHRGAAVRLVSRSQTLWVGDTMGRVLRDTYQAAPSGSRARGPQQADRRGDRPHLGRPHLVVQGIVSRNMCGTAAPFRVASALHGGIWDLRKPLESLGSVRDRLATRRDAQKPPSGRPMCLISRRKVWLRAQDLTYAEHKMY